MQKDKRCETCINKDQFGKTFCTVCENGDMYKEKGKLKYIDYNKYTRAVADERYHPKTTLPITNVIFAPPATIVFWNDGTKSVVKCENEIFDPEKGLAMAIAKRALGNKGNYYETFKKWITDDIKIPQPVVKEGKPWRIWTRTVDADTGEVTGIGQSVKSYKRKCDATRIANMTYAGVENLTYIVAQENPWA